MNVLWKLVLGAWCFHSAAFTSRAAETNSRPTLWLIGDSTVRNGNGRGADAMWGWGSLIGAHFDAEKIRVENRAIGGRSSRTFLTEGRWDDVLKQIQPGDFVMMQFGHNDGGGLNGNKGRGSLKGNGDETQTITNSSGKVEVVQTYGWYLRRYIADSKAKDAIPIVISQIPRNIWKDGKVGRESSGYGKFAKDAAEQGGAAFLDLNRLVADRYDKLGEDAVRAAFFKPTDHTHTTLAGARFNADTVASGLRDMPEVGLGKKLLPPGSVPADNGIAYLFSYFVDNGQDGLHLAWSSDGYKWEALNGGKSFLKPLVGESKLMRDPCVLRGPDGIFHMVWTTAWQGKTIGYASSSNLIHWSEQQAIPVMAHEPAAINCWAPEIVWDKKRSEFMIFWATTITNKFLETAGGGDEKYNHRMYATTTRDFKTYSPTKLFYDPGFNVIDATMLSVRGKYHFIVKDETRNPVKKNLRIATGDDIAGPFSAAGEPFTRDWVEGPSTLRIGEEFIVYFDAYRDRRYEAMTSKDLRTWENVTSKISFPKGVRHGTAISVSKEILDGLMNLNRE